MEFGIIMQHKNVIKQNIYSRGQVFSKLTVSYYCI